MNVYSCKKGLFNVLLMCAIFTSCKQTKEEDQATPTNPKLRFVASWKCTEVSSQTGAATFYVHIVDSIGDYVLIENLYNKGFNYKIKAHIDGDNINVNGVQNISGILIKNCSGKMENSTQIKMNYIADDGLNKMDTCSATLIKQ